MELSGTLEGSLQIKNNLEAPTLVMYKGMYKMALEDSTPHTIPNYQLSIDVCGHFLQ